MKNLTKALVGTVAAGAMAVSTATPALAKHSDNKIGAGEVIAGALIVGGIAAIAASASKNKRDAYAYGRDHRYNDRYRHGRGYGMNRSEAVNRCVRAAERDASRYGYGRADVTQVTKVSRKNGGFNVKGRIVVKDRGHSWRHRGYGHDRGKFSCKIRYGRVADVNFSGLRGYH
jgi:hypothetical protein